MKLNEPSGMGRVIFPFVARVLEMVIFRLVDHIAVETESIIERGPFSGYKCKVSANGAFYVDTCHFTSNRELRDRRELVGFIGLLFPVKGVVNFVDAIPLILRQLPNVEFVICGSGSLFEEIKEDLERVGLSDKVKLTGWLSSDKVADYLNQMKLLVLPSYEEGLPNIILEAMACGTPVLATPIGGIPNVIKDEKTGFILENNSAESIARGVLKALNHPKLLEITKNARALIESKYSYTAAIHRYENILTILC
jgi:glycosyltransferase involved in cell wall biosynthesis